MQNISSTSKLCGLVLLQLLAGASGIAAAFTLRPVDTSKPVDMDTFFEENGENAEGQSYEVVKLAEFRQRTPTTFSTPRGTYTVDWADAPIGPRVFLDATKQLAIKVVDKRELVQKDENGVDRDQDYYKRTVVNEINALVKLRHQPNIVQLLQECCLP